MSSKLKCAISITFKALRGSTGLFINHAFIPVPFKPGVALSSQPTLGYRRYLGCSRRQNSVILRKEVVMAKESTQPKVCNLVENVPSELDLIVVGQVMTRIKSQ